MNTEPLLRASNLATSETSFVPDPAASEYENASLAYKEGDYAYAARLLQAHLLNHPGSVAAHYARGLSTAALGDHSSAEAEYRWVVAQQPHHLDALYRLAVILHETAGANLIRLSEAATLFGRLLSVSKVPDAQRRLYEIRLKLHPQQPLPTSTKPAHTAQADDAVSQFTWPDGSNDQAVQSRLAPSSPAQVTTNILRPLAADLDEGNVADPGQLMRKTRRAARSYGPSWIFAAALLVAGVTISEQFNQMVPVSTANMEATSPVDRGAVAAWPLAAAAVVVTRWLWSVSCCARTRPSTSSMKDGLTSPGEFCIEAESLSGITTLPTSHTSGAY
jgi:hypothetical protein